MKCDDFIRVGTQFTNCPKEATVYYGWEGCTYCGGQDCRDYADRWYSCDEHQEKDNGEEWIRIDAEPS